jgi:hypothetical protein
MYLLNNVDIVNVIVSYDDDVISDDDINYVMIMLILLM